MDFWPERGLDFWLRKHLRNVETGAELHQTNSPALQASAIERPSRADDAASSTFGILNRAAAALTNAALIRPPNGTNGLVRLSLGGSKDLTSAERARRFWLPDKPAFTFHMRL
jgi:hypothetical protein